MFTFPWARITQNSNWLALATIDSFFAWTEHIFIHLAILQGRVVTEEEVAQLAESEWKVKFKCALNISDSILKGYFDELIIVRRQLRNFVAHGAFGKEGEAFSFHSKKSDIRLFFHTALTREAARSRPARLKWSHLLNTSATTLRRYSLNILKELGKV